MPLPSPRSVLRALPPLLALLGTLPAGAEIVINELMASGSDRLLRWSAAGVPTLGTGTPWYASGFSDASWSTGTGPFGFGTFTNVSPAPVITTNTATQMQNLTPTLYLRKSFTVSASDAGRADLLSFDVQFNDGFVCYLNGVEVIRRNAGPANQFVYRDQFAAFGTPANTESTTTPYLRTETLTLGAANTRLLSGTNTLAVHALNYWEATSLLNTSTNVFASINNRDNFYFKGDLRITAAPAVTLVANNTAWRYLPGVVEPSGGLYDPTQIFLAKQNARWGRPSFDDSAWNSGASPLGAGTPPAGVTLGTNLTTSIPGKATSLYARTVFTATAADIADPLMLQLLMDYDDGFVAYLNGVEVARAGMAEANSFTPHNAVASAARTPGSYTTYNLDPPARLLIQGQNVFSVQIHNVTLNDADLFFRAQLRTNSAGTNRTLVTPTGIFNYFVGTGEPVESEDDALEDNPEAPDSALDWVELHNNGTAAVSLGNWTFSDSASLPAKWTFPPEATLPAGGYLLLACDDLNITAPAPGGFYHTGFKLGSEGESLVLCDSLGTIVQQTTFPAQTAFQSYGRSGDGSYRFHEAPTPGTANAGAVLTGKVAAPVLSLAGGFYPGSRTVSFSSSTPGATLRYTLNGTEPTETNGTAGTTATLSSSRALRVRAFAAGLIPSDTITRTYLIAEPVSRQGLPALCVTGDEQRSLYQPFGAMAIKGGAFPNYVAPLPTNNNGVWTQTGATAGTPADLDAYNNPIHRGRFIERPAHLEILRADGTPGPNIGFGLRVSGSGHARPRYKLTNQNRTPGASPAPNDGAWSATSFTEKPSFNFFFRDDYGGDPLEHSLFPGYPVNQFHDVRVRAGKNDPSNPFVEDEFMRRVFISTGQEGSRGMINTLYVNGIYKGYYNLCEHIREDFLQRHHGGTHAWDVRQVTAIASGDGLAFQEMLTYIRNNPQSTPANYQGMKTRLDMVNFADYLIVNLLGVTGDWPHNNFVCARERSVNGLHRYYLWDAEGAFGDFSGNVRTNMFVAGTTGSIITTAPATAGQGEGIRILYTLLRASPEFKLLFADRIQKHFFNGGALTESRLLTAWNVLKSELAPVIAPTLVTDRVAPWLNGVGDATRYTTTGATNTPSRRNVLFNGYTDDVAGGTFVQPHLVAEGLWPATRAPGFSQTPGPVASGSSLALTNPNAAGTIYFTLTGLDPRSEGGIVAGTAYSAPLTITYGTTVKARVRSTAGEWSPLVEGTFLTATVEPLVLSELMYHPTDFGTVDGDEYEFLELRNAGTQTLQLGGMKFTAGIDYTFAPGSTIAPAARLVLARITSRFLEKYPAVTPHGEWGAASNLANSGETLTLTNPAGLTVFSVTWSDAAPWPGEADGLGRSLVPVDPDAAATPALASGWRTSSQPEGSPGLDDPAPPAPTVYLNELLSNALAPDTDRIELYNPNPVAVDVSHWWISDSNNLLQKFRIPPGTVIPASGFLVFSESDFNTGLNAFAFSSTGENAVLSSGDANGALTGYSTSLSFGPADPGVSFGRYLNSRGTAFFTAQDNSSFGTANTGPQAGPVVLSELLYWPVTGNDEFVELRNISTQPVPLFDPGNPANVWRIDGTGFSFPAGITLAPGQIVLVVPINPETFRTKYSIPAATAIYGPATASLRNEGEQITLQKPGPPYLDGAGLTVVPFVDVDRVTYSPLAPWPVSAGGPNGISLERLNAHAFGDDPANWRAATAPGGTSGRPAALTWAQWSALHFTPLQQADPATGTAGADSDFDGLTNAEEWAYGTYPWQPEATPTTGKMVPVGPVRHLQLSTRRSRSATGLTLQADTSANLNFWSPGAAPLTGTPIDHGDGTESISFRHPTPVTNDTRQFLRLRILSN